MNRDPDLAIKLSESLVAYARRVGKSDGTRELLHIVLTEQSFLDEGVYVPPQEIIIQSDDLRKLWNKFSPLLPPTKTGAQWNEVEAARTGMAIIDPDGWDRTTGEYETLLLTYDEFKDRQTRSTLGPVQEQ